MSWGAGSAAYKPASFGSRLSPIDKELKKAEQMSEKARLDNMARQQQIEAIFDEIINRYQPGGAFEQRAMAQLATQKARDVKREYGSGVQDMISRGLYGTSVMPTKGEVGQRWERDIGSPARMTLEDLMMQRLSGAQTNKASFLERIENQYPDAGQIAQLAGQAASGPISRTYNTTPGEFRIGTLANMQSGTSRGLGIDWSAKYPGLSAEEKAKRSAAATAAKAPAAEPEIRKGPFTGYQKIISGDIWQWTGSGYKKIGRSAKSMNMTPQSTAHKEYIKKQYTSPLPKPKPKKKLPTYRHDVVHIGGM